MTTPDPLAPQAREQLEQVRATQSDEPADLDAGPTITREQALKALSLETYTDEGGEIVMRELRRVQQERDEARAAVERLRAGIEALAPLLTEATDAVLAVRPTESADLRERVARITAWLDDDEDLRIPDDEWGQGLYSDLRAVLAVVRPTETGGA